MDCTQARMRIFTLALFSQDNRIVRFHRADLSDNEPIIGTEIRMKNSSGQVQSEQSALHVLREGTIGIGAATPGRAAKPAARHRNGNASVPLVPRPRAPNARRQREYAHISGVDADLAPILLVGGPYQGMRVRENWHAKGLYLIHGEKGDFVYKLHQRLHARAIAVPFDASPKEIQTSLFKFAGLGLATLPNPQHPTIDEADLYQVFESDFAGSNHHAAHESHAIG